MGAGQELLDPGRALDPLRLDVDSGLGRVGLDDLGDLDALFARRLAGDGEGRGAVGVARFADQPLGFVQVEVVDVERLVVGGREGGPDHVLDRGQPLEQLLGDPLAVDAAVERPPHGGVVHHRMAAAAPGADHAEHPDRAGRRGQLQVVVGIGVQARVERLGQMVGEVDLAVLQRQRHRIRILEDVPLDRVEVGRLVEVLEAVGARVDVHFIGVGVPLEGPAAVDAHEPFEPLDVVGIVDLRPLEDVEDRGAGPGEVELQGRVVDGGDLADVLVVDRADLAVGHVLVVHPLEALAHLFGRHRLAVVELEAGAQFDHQHRLVVVEFPGFGEVRLRVEALGVVLGQRVPEGGVEDGVRRGGIGGEVDRGGAIGPAGAEDAALLADAVVLVGDRAGGRRLRLGLLLLRGRLFLFLLLLRLRGRRGLGLLSLLLVVVAAAADEGHAGRADGGAGARAHQRSAAHPFRADPIPIAAVAHRSFPSPDGRRGGATPPSRSSASRGC